MRSAKNNLREAEDSVFAPSAGTEVHRCRPFAVLEVSCFTAVARQGGARALLEPRDGLAGWGCVLSTPDAGVVGFWAPERWARPGPPLPVGPPLPPRHRR